MAKLNFARKEKDTIDLLVAVSSLCPNLASLTLKDAAVSFLSQPGVSLTFSTVQTHSDGSQLSVPLSDARMRYFCSVNSCSNRRWRLNRNMPNELFLSVKTISKETF